MPRRCRVFRRLNAHYRRLSRQTATTGNASAPNVSPSRQRSRSVRTSGRVRQHYTQSGLPSYKIWNDKFAPGSRARAAEVPCTGRPRLSVALHDRAKIPTMSLRRPDVFRTPAEAEPHWIRRSDVSGEVGLELVAVELVRRITSPVGGFIRFRLGLRCASDVGTAWAGHG